MFFGKRFSGHTMKDMSGLDVLVLTIIKNSESGISGYDISLSIKRTFGGMWKASAGTIYPLLSRLTEKGYLIMEEITSSNRQKKLYKISKDGEEKLEKVLKGNIEHSINALGGFLQSITDSFPPIAETIDNCFRGEPFSCGHEVDEATLTVKDIPRIETRLDRLKNRKTQAQNRIKNIDDQIRKYEIILEDLIEQEKNRKPIETVEDDEEFDNI